ncbi:MAG: sulfatase-like hydrolase/transferase [Bacteroidetes bacterium]|nr:sulfatase-like hydrolase/transferase [Bacteroidota bacterium]
MYPLLRFLTLAAAGVCFGVLTLQAQSLAPSPTPGSKPNIIFISVDDFNDFTGYLYGHPQTFTPNMDRIAARGTVFKNAYTAVPVCAPSRNCFLTGKAADYSGLYSNEEYLADILPSKTFRSLYNLGSAPLQVETIPAWLKDAGGYYTLGMGKLFHGWARDGYDRDYDAANLDPCSRGLSWSEFRDFNPKDDPRPDQGLAGEYGDGVTNVSVGQLEDSEEPLMMDYKQTSSAISFLQDYGSNPGAYCNKPFFLAVGMYRPHEPFTAPEKYFLDDYQPDLYQRPYDLPYNFPPEAYPPNGVVMPNQPHPAYSDFDNLSYIGQLMALGLGTHDNYQTFANTLDSVPRFSDTLTLAERKQIVAESRRATTVMAYLAAIRYVDAQIGRLMDALEANPELAANTVVVLFSDHGFSLGEKKHWFKNALWETDLRVPLVIQDPRVSGGKVQTAPVSLLDLFPTLCDMTGTPEPQTASGDRYLDGRSLKEAMNGETIDGLKPVVTALRLPERFTISCYPFYSVRTERYHLIRYRVPLGSASCASGIYEDVFELYEIGTNRKVDPKEWRNLAGLPGYAVIRDWLASFIPGEPLAGTIQPVMDISTSAVSCADFSASDTLLLSATLNTAGTGFGPAEYAFRWSINDLPLVFGGNAVSIPLSVLPSSWFSTPTEVVFRAVALNSNNEVVTVDNFTLNLGNGLPDPSFTATVDANGAVAVSPLVDFPQTGAEFSRWNYGDGIVLDERLPAPHRYRNPGVYPVIHSRFYGAESGCVVKDTQWVSVDTAVIGTECHSPYPALLLDNSPASARLSITPVYRADYYQWRYQTPNHADAIWSYGDLTFTPEVQLNGLKEGAVHQVQVKAYCTDGSESEWSYPMYFNTSPCLPPFGPSANPASTNAMVSWEPRDESIGGTLMYIQSPGQPLRQAYAGPALSQRLLTPLLSNKFYRIYLVSICRNLGGAATYVGQTYTSVLFKTLPPGATAREESADQDDADLLLWPNPTNGVFQALPSGRRGPATLRVLSDDGRLVRTLNLDADSVGQVDLSNLPAGMYHVEWVEGGLTRSVILTGL